MALQSVLRPSLRKMGGTGRSVRRQHQWRSMWRCFSHVRGESTRGGVHRASACRVRGRWWSASHQFLQCSQLARVLEYIQPAPAEIAAPVPVMMYIASAPNRIFRASGGIFRASACRGCGDSSSCAVSASVCGGVHRDCASRVLGASFRRACSSSVYGRVHLVIPAGSVAPVPTCTQRQHHTQMIVFVGQALREGRGEFSVSRCGDTLYFQHCSGRCFEGTSRSVREWHCQHSGCRGCSGSAQTRGLVEALELAQLKVVGQLPPTSSCPVAPSALPLPTVTTCLVLSMARSSFRVAMAIEDHSP